VEAAITLARVHVVTRETPSRIETVYGTAPATRQHVIVMLGAGDVIGWGEASPVSEFTGETTPGIARVLETAYLPGVLGRDPYAIGKIMDDMDRMLPGNPSAKAAIDTALHDLVGRLSDRPVCRLLGGPRRPAVILARAIGVAPVEQAVALARGYVEAGFRTLKLKVGSDPREDVVRVRAVRGAVGPDVALRLDANQGYDVEAALWVLDRLETSGLEYVEQPLPAGDLAGLRTLRRRTPARLMADEGVRTPQDARTLAQDRLVDLFSIKLIKTGGLTRALEIAAIADGAGIECVVSSPYETQIGAAAGLHLAVSIERASCAHELTVFVTQPHLAATDIVLDGCRLRPGTTGGLGVDRIAELDRTVGPPKTA
jgi:L-alanine-DL-glutamate epimerase-like enolase superfamily enzyme